MRTKVESSKTLNRINSVKDILLECDIYHIKFVNYLMKANPTGTICRDAEWRMSRF